MSTLQPRSSAPPKASGSTVAESNLRVRNAFRLVLILDLALLVAVIVYLYLAWQTQTWRVYALLGIVAVTGVVSSIAVIFMRRGRLNLSISLIVGVIGVLLPSTSLLVAGLGAVLGLGVSLGLALIVGQVLPQKKAGWAITASVASGILTWLLDVFVPVDRLVVLQIEIIAPVAAIAVFAILGFFLARQFANYSLRTKLIVAFLVIGLLPLAGAAGLSIGYTQNALVTAANQTLNAAAKQTAASLDDFINASLDEINAEAQLRTLRNYLELPAGQRQPGSPSEKEIVALLANLENKQVRSLSVPDRPTAYILSYSLLDRDGRIVASTSATDTGSNVYDRDYFQTPFQTGKAYMSPVEFSPGPGSFYASDQIRDTTGSPIGVLAARFDAALLQQLVAASNGLAGEKSFAILFDENHLYLAHGASPGTLFKSVAPLDQDRVAELQAARRLPDLPAGEASTNLPDLEQYLTNAAAQSFFATKDNSTSSQESQVAVATMKTQPWLVAFVQPEELFLAPIHSQTRVLTLFAVTVFVVVMGIAVFMGRLLTGSITRLTVVAKKISAGDLTAQTQVETRDEIGTLAKTFNTMTAQLRGMIDSLEQRVEARTAQLKASADVGRAAASTLDPDQLLHEIIDLIADRFGFYYAAVFTIDKTGQWAVLREATGQAGETLKARGHKLEVGGKSMVGSVTYSRQPRVALDVGKEAVRFNNPLLPETRSEIALPLVVGDDVLGALDVQSTEAGAFDEVSTALLQSMADQIAVALSNAQSFEQTRSALAETDVLYRTSQAIGKAQTPQEILEATKPVAEFLGMNGVSMRLITRWDEQGYPVALDIYSIALAQAEWSPQLPIRGVPADEPETIQTLLHDPSQVSAFVDAQGLSSPIPHTVRKLMRDTGQKSALMVGLNVQGEPLGFLFLTSQKPMTDLSERHVRVIIRTLADQMAVALQNRRLLELTRRALDELDAINRRLTGEAWAKYLRHKSRQSTISIGSGTTSSPEIDQALSTQQVVVKRDTAAWAAHVAVPIILRGQPIGALQLRVPVDTWDDDLQTIINRITGHIAQAAENARLLEVTEERFAREHALSESTDKIRRGTEVERILQTAAEELAYHLQAACVSVRLGDSVGDGEASPAVQQNQG